MIVELRTQVEKVQQGTLHNEVLQLTKQLMDIQVEYKAPLPVVADVERVASELTIEPEKAPQEVRVTHLATVAVNIPDGREGVVDELTLDLMHLLI